MAGGRGVCVPREICDLRLECLQSSLHRTTDPVGSGRRGGLAGAGRCPGDRDVEERDREMAGVGLGGRGSA